jgi:hypothetical protein
VPRPILDRLGLEAVRIGGTVRNLPPASVYRISRREPFGYREREAEIDDVAAFSNETGG